MADAAEAASGEAIDDGGAFPVRQALFMSREQSRWIEARARKRGVSRAAMIRFCIEAMMSDGQSGLVREDLRLEVKRLDAEVARQREIIQRMSRRWRKTDYGAARKRLNKAKGSSWTVAETREILDITYNAMFKLVSRGDIETVGERGERRITRGAILRYLDRHEALAAPTRQT